ncbi:MAG: histone deacetylase [Tetrasphaera sp.]
MRVWYVAYGSNLLRERFLLYVAGGIPAGARRAMPGCRDTAPPQGDQPLQVRGQIRFAWESPTWGGGIAFLDPGTDGHALARAYLVTADQFVDIATQEMHRQPGEDDIDLRPVLQKGRHAYGPGRYETLHLLGRLDGAPLLTFSADEPRELPLNAPGPAYLRILAAGLHEAHGLTPREVAAYLLTRPSVSAGWTKPALIDLIAEPGPRSAVVAACGPAGHPPLP